MRERLLAVALAALMVASVTVGGAAGVAGAQEADPADPLPENATDLGEADDAYVAENGDVVLVYDTDATETDAGTQVEYGLDVGESVLHALVVTTNTTDSNVTGDATAVLSPDRLSANGSLAAPSPESLESLTFDASSVQSDETAEADLSLSATLAAGESEPGQQVGGLVETVDFSTDARYGPDTLSANGSFDANLTTPLGSPQEQSFRLVESESGYTLDAEQNYTVSGYSRDGWETREAARDTLESQYASLATSLDGEATVTLESYSFENVTGGYGDAGRLDIAFTVEYTGIDAGLRDRIVTSLADSEDVNLTDAEAEEVARGVTDLRVDEISASLDAGESSYAGEYTVRLSNYAGALRAGLTLAESVQPPETGVEGTSSLGTTDFDRVRDTLDARQEAGLVETYALDASVATGDDGTTVDVTGEYRTENWAAYRDALAARNVSTADAEMSLHAETTGDGELAVEGSYTVEQDALLDTALDSLYNSTNETESADARRFVEAFRDADLRRARMDASFEGDRVRIEAGAAFENMSEFRTAFRETTGTDLNVASAVGRTDNGSVTSYVRVVGAVPGNATEEDVRALDPVTENTTVHLAGTYNRTFPEADVVGAYEYLGLNRSNGSETTQTPGQPGFGVAAAVVALAGAALLARRE
ncbi:PGF-CTERM sorting domain-containing protein [Halosegnis marinus]|uniref:PGF-CTERM sorting domain-containing protein n=1 Tax=Halosegnis marinus TaxID=3034023 RepID=A0ABD5ZKX3_9EURY|nr:PGF-CTERM sorting domain-containing protein [Halosegnis sp. DT85]